jgi:hypothetical protein
LFSSFLQPAVTSSLFGANTHIPLITLFSNTRSLCSSLKVRDQLSRLHKTTCAASVPCILNF